jgi:Protein of unknown function (DUF1800)
MAGKLSPLEQIDPADAWQPWQPTTTEPWNRKWASHLYRRATFGPSREDLVEAERIGPHATLERLLRGSPNAEEIRESVEDVGRVAAKDDGGGGQLRSWWLYVMLQSGHPLREKLTLFWHNHFATSIAKVQDPVLMFQQNCLLRTHALGHFEPFLQAVSKDPAMLVWLDSNSNLKGKPNENYARELMELFSLGVGNYSERDVREAARAFTGWHTDGHDFKFDPRAHDTGPKTVLHQTGAWDGSNVVHIVLQQPAAARFLVRKLYHFLISETDPPPALLVPLCEAFRKSNYDIGELVKTMLSSRHFYSAYAYRRRIKSPVEYVLGAVRMICRRYGESDPNYRPLPAQALAPRVTAMGQELFAPPNVKGWAGGAAWLNTSTLVERGNFACALADGTLWNYSEQIQTGALAPFAMRRGARALFGEADTSGATSGHGPAKAFDVCRLLEEENAHHADDAARVLLDLFLPGGVRAKTHARLVAFLNDDNPTGAALERRAREAVHAILTMAEYHLA